MPKAMRVRAIGGGLVIDDYFAQCIKCEARDGYLLHSWTAVGNRIVAVFEEVAEPDELIENTELSNRAKNALRFSKIETVSQLAKTPYRNLRRLKGLGHTCLQEIHDMLLLRGLRRIK